MDHLNHPQGITNHQKNQQSQNQSAVLLSLSPAGGAVFIFSTQIGLKASSHEDKDVSQDETSETETLNMVF